ncbi:uncharacterized protein BO96DRAFT_455103 [Aspergillus niger CBS 101883]|uniref:Uncharacterized protein n=1 Tax=Aspergillus niger ATCC 13496 TaxID=1353008 RepID=A0A370C4E6_ASPNG|nr:uncharacterized protein BO96DRAFT_455103 [Aspergillus niger CBS 101883]PYH58344.1 hypothetical protein BO96DRAFT_455103 [Aspergillus niger CBS 101883]RDH22715.1 hypothetical protein M747DRAFT_293796 [Aspergillus niger ATCC 13496]
MHLLPLLDVGQEEPYTLLVDCGLGVDGVQVQVQRLAGHLEHLLRELCLDRAGRISVEVGGLLDRPRGSTLTAGMEREGPGAGGSMRVQADLVSDGQLCCVCWVVGCKEHEQLVPIGAVGELLIEGLIVGYGYLNITEQTGAAST